MTTSKQSEEALREFRHAKLDEAQAMLGMVEREKLVKTMVSLASFYALVIGMLRNKMDNAEIFETASRCYSMTMAELPPEVFELVMSAVVGEEVSIYESTRS